jgi:hypothetical protein
MHTTSSTAGRISLPAALRSIGTTKKSAAVHPTRDIDIGPATFDEFDQEILTTVGFDVPHQIPGFHGTADRLPNMDPQATMA